MKATIAKADITPTAPTAVANLVYTGQAQTLIAAGSATGGEMQYSLDGETYATTLPTGTNANEYTVYYKVIGDANHNDVAAANFKVTIDKAALTAVVLTETNFVYNQQEQTAEVSSVTAGTLVVTQDSYEISGNKATNVGNYTATVTGKGNFKGTATAQYSILAENANTFDITLGTTEYTFDGTAKTPTVTVKDGETTLTENTDYTLAYSNNIAAGTANVTATGIGNYTGTQTAQFTIKKADITNVTAPIAITGLVYTGEDQMLAEPGSATDGEMKYSLDNSQWNSTVPTGNEIGEYTVYYKVIGDANHNDVAAQSFKVDIAGYELTIAAGEYATYYRDDTALTLSIASAEKAQMYTVTNVDENTADVTELEVADKGTPLLVMNTTDEELTVYLVPTEATADEVTVAKEFKGTADAQEMPASSESCDYYAMTGKAFVWVRDAGTIGANKCWLEISNQPAASRANTRSIGGGSDTTGINSVESGQLTDDSYYDLQGRKVAKPNRKGIYIKNGRKVVLK